MKRFMSWFLILALMIPAGALADITIVSFDDDPTSAPVVISPTPTPGSGSILPTYNPYETDYKWPTPTPAPVSRTLK